MPGVYSSGDSGIADMQTTATVPAIRGPSRRRSGSRCGTTRPTWTGRPRVCGLAVGQRTKQYQGNDTVKVGGITLNIDTDIVASAVVPGDRPVPVRTGRIQFAMTGAGS